MALRILVVIGLLALLFRPLIRESGILYRIGGNGGEAFLVARVLEIVDEGAMDLGQGLAGGYQTLLLEVESGPLAGEEIRIGDDAVNTVMTEMSYKAGDRVYVERMPGPEGDHYFITGQVRTGPLLGALAIFVGAVALVARGKGLRSLGGAIFSLAVILGFVVPRVLAGDDPVRVAITGSVVLLAVSTLLIYGVTLKSLAAIVGMSLSLALTGLVASWLSTWARLSGLGDEAVTYLAIELGSRIQFSGLLLGGIIIGSLGVLDDICIGQASAAFELAQANPDLGWQSLFGRAMNIGRDHIAASVNTLLLAYMGTSLPLILLFALYQEPLLQRLNREPMAEEIARTLAGSMGLVLAVPVTTLVASLLASWWVSRREAGHPS